MLASPGKLRFSEATMQGITLLVNSIPKIEEEHATKEVNAGVALGHNICN